MLHNAAIVPVIALCLLANDQAWWSAGTLRQTLGSDAGRLLAHDTGPGAGLPSYAFLAADCTAPYKDNAHRVLRSIVILNPAGMERPAAAVHFDLVESPQPDFPEALDRTHARQQWPIETRLLDTTSAGDRLSLGVFHRAATDKPGLIHGVGLAGASVADWVVLFHTESRTARSALSFYDPGAGPRKYLITGLAPGTWEIWHDGWLVDHQGSVRPPSHSLYFEGKPGDYFLRRLN